MNNFDKYRVLGYEVYNWYNFNIIISKENKMSIIVNNKLLSMNELLIENFNGREETDGGIYVSGIGKGRYIRIMSDAIGSLFKESNIFIDTDGNVILGYGIYDLGKEVIYISQNMAGLVMNDEKVSIKYGFKKFNGVASEMSRMEQNKIYKIPNSDYKYIIGELYIDFENNFVKKLCHPIEIYTNHIIDDVERYKQSLAGYKNFRGIGRFWHCLRISDNRESRFESCENKVDMRDGSIITTIINSDGELLGNRVSIRACKVYNEKLFEHKYGKWNKVL